MVAHDEPRAEREGRVGHRHDAQPLHLALVAAQVLRGGDEVVVDHVVGLPVGRVALPGEGDRLRAVVHVRERQHVVAPEVEERARQIQPDAHGHARAAAPVDRAWPEHHEREAEPLLVLPEQPLLPELGLRVDVAPLGVALEGRRLVDERAARQLGDAVDAERADEHDLRRLWWAAAMASSRCFEVTTVLRNMSAGAPASEAARW